MYQDIFQELKNELINGSIKKGHPFRYFTFATLNDSKPRLRTVVLRKMESNLTLLFYTDARSQKVIDIKRNNQVAALFYHPKKLVQLQIEGTAKINLNTNANLQLWKQLPETAKADYLSNLAPGTQIENPDNLYLNSEENNFCSIEIVPTHIEYLKLNKPKHQRIRFLKDGNNEWQGIFLVP